MTLRADHVAGAAFIAFGVLIIAMSGDLPFGDLAMPGSGFMPILISVLMIILGIALTARAAESPPLASIQWGDSKHAVMVLLITAAAIALYERIGFLITMSAMMLAFLIVIERRGFVRAAAFSIAVAVITFVSFEYVLRTPLADGPFGF